MGWVGEVCLLRVCAWLKYGDVAGLVNITVNILT